MALQAKERPGSRRVQALVAQTHATPQFRVKVQVKVQAKAVDLQLRGARARVIFRAHLLVNPVRWVKWVKPVNHPQRLGLAARPWPAMCRKKRRKRRACKQRLPRWPAHVCERKA